jgi:ABC-2 type transport system permease protein
MIEPQLAGSMSRTRWATQRLLIPAVGSALLLLVGGAAMGAGYGSIVGDPSQIGRLALSALAYWPAVMVFVGIAVALFGWVPRMAIPLSWGVLAAMWFIVLIGDALHLPSWILNLLPFSATPNVPYAPLTWPPLGIMTLVAGVLIWTGLNRFEHRDVQPE